jgi:hypothetical protein
MKTTIFPWLSAKADVAARSSETASAAAATARAPAEQSDLNFDDPSTVSSFLERFRHDQGESRRQTPLSRRLLGLLRANQFELSRHGA